MEGEIDSVRKVGNIYRYRVLIRLHGKILDFYTDESYTKPKVGRFKLLG